MTQLTDEEIQKRWNEACLDMGPEWCRHLRFSRAIIAAHEAKQAQGGDEALLYDVKDALMAMQTDSNYLLTLIGADLMRRLNAAIAAQKGGE